MDNRLTWVIPDNELIDPTPILPLTSTASSTRESVSEPSSRLTAKDEALARPAPPSQSHSAASNDFSAEDRSRSRSHEQRRGPRESESPQVVPTSAAARPMAPMDPFMAFSPAPPTFRPELSWSVVEEEQVAPTASVAAIAPHMSSQQAPSTAVSSAATCRDADFKMADRRTSSFSRFEANSNARSTDHSIRSRRNVRTRDPPPRPSDDARTLSEAAVNPSFGTPSTVNTSELSWGVSEEGGDKAAPFANTIAAPARPVSPQPEARDRPSEASLAIPGNPSQSTDPRWNAVEEVHVASSSTTRAAASRMTKLPLATTPIISDNKGTLPFKEVSIPVERAAVPGRSLQQPREGRPPLPSNSSPTTTTTPQTRPRSIALAEGPSGPLQHIIMVSGIEGKIGLLNELARKHDARAIIHVGNFGFYDAQSTTRIPISDLRHAAQRELGLEAASKMSDAEIVSVVSERSLLSELPSFCHGKKRLDVPVYVVSGQYEDFAVVEKLCKGIYHVPNLYILDHRSSYAISSGDLTVRLFGIGGSFSYPKLFDVGSGNEYVCGGEGKVWVSMSQLGELLELAEQYDDPTEVRVFVAQTSPSKEPLVHFIAAHLAADYTVGCSPRAQGCSVYNYVAVHGEAFLLDTLKACRTDIKSLWEQIYFAAHDKFTNVQRRRCGKVIACLERDVSGSIAQIQDHTTINVCPVSDGHARLSLGTDGLVIQSWSQQSLKREASKTTTASTVEPILSSAASTDPRPATSSIAVEERERQREEGEKKEKEKEKKEEETKAEKTEEKKAEKTEEKKAEKTEEKQEETKSNASRPALDLDVAASFPSATSRVTGDVRSERNGSFYIDRTSADKRAELSLFLSNLPYDVSGEELDASLLSNYDIDCIEFMGARNANAVVVFKRVEDVVQACLDLQNASLHGRGIRVRRDRRFESRDAATATAAASSPAPSPSSRTTRYD